MGQGLRGSQGGRRNCVQRGNRKAANQSVRTRLWLWGCAPLPTAAQRALRRQEGGFQCHGCWPKSVYGVISLPLVRRVRYQSWGTVPRSLWWDISGFAPWHFVSPSHKRPKPRRVAHTCLEGNQASENRKLGSASEGPPGLLIGSQVRLRRVGFDGARKAAGGSVPDVGFAAGGCMRYERHHGRWLEYAETLCVV